MAFKQLITKLIDIHVLASIVVIATAIGSLSYNLGVNSVKSEQIILTQKNGELKKDNIQLKEKIESSDISRLRIQQLIHQVDSLENQINSMTASKEDWSGKWFVTEYRPNSNIKGEMMMSIQNNQMTGNCIYEDHSSLSLSGVCLERNGYQFVEGQWNNPTSRKSGKFLFHLISKNGFDGNYSIGNINIDTRTNHWTGKKVD